MNKSRITAIVLALVVACATAWAQGPSGEQATPIGKDEPQTRSVVGQVTDQGSQPLPNAIVHLKNTKTLAVSTFITRDDGKYRFTALVPNVDYEIFAEQNGKKSSTKTLSAFESRPTVTVNLHIDTGK